MTWLRGKTSDGKPDPYFIESATHRICRVNIGPVRVYELWKIGTQGRVSEKVASKRCMTDDEAKMAVEELKQVCEKDAK